MIRTILVLLFLLCFFIISIPLYLIEAIIDISTSIRKNAASFVIVTTALKIIIWLSGIHLIVKGQEKVPKDQAVLICFQSSKLFRYRNIVPPDQQYHRFCCQERAGTDSFYPDAGCSYMNCQFLDRENIKEGLKTILNCIATVKGGCSVCIFPEGTRTPGDDMLEFKEGSFKIAEKSGCLIIPVAITNTENVFENHIPFIKASTVIIEFGDPIDLNAMPKEERRHIGSQVQGIIGGMLKENSLANVES